MVDAEKNSEIIIVNPVTASSVQIARALID